MTTHDRPLRVAYLLLRPPSYSETFINSEIRTVHAAGVDVMVFPTRPDHSSRIADAARALWAGLRHPLRLAAHVNRLGTGYGPRALLAAACAVDLAGAVRRFAPDIVHAHFVNLPTAIAVLLAAELGVPATAMAHAADVTLDANRVALRRRLSQLDHLFVISAATAGQLAAAGVDLAATPNSVVRAAFDGEYREGPPPRPAASDDPVRLITIARLVEKKGVATAVEAVARLVGEGRPVRYDVYGDGPLRDELRCRIDALQLSAVVTLHGAVAHDVAMRALAAAHVAVLPCRRAENGDVDGIPIFLMEAAARGVPVVTTGVSGIPELVEPDTGWLVPPEDCEALTDAIRCVVEAPEESIRRSAALRDRLRGEYAPHLQARRLVARWRQLVSPGGR